MASSSRTTKVPYTASSDSSTDVTGQFSSLDTILSQDSESPQELTPEQRREQEAEQRVEALKKCLGGWRIAGGVLGIMMVLGWVCIIAVLILEEKWQLVLIAWLLLYAAAHFCYWYFKRHSLMSLNNQLRNGLTRLRNAEKAASDKPPSYDDVIKSEPPPPAYYSVVEESPKGLEKIKKSFMATGAIPKVFKFASKSSTNLPQEESSKRKSSGSLVVGTTPSLFIVDEYFARNGTNSNNQPGASREGIQIPGMIVSDHSLAQTEVLPPPSYDSIQFSTDVAIVENSQTPHRKLSKIAIDITEVE